MKDLCALLRFFHGKSISPGQRVRQALDAGKSARSVECTEEEAELLSTVSLLTNKPVIYAANMSEGDFKGGVENNPYFAAVKQIADSEHAGVLPICAEIEAEISGMEREEKELFLADMGLTESGLDRLINECYSLLGLISYLTAGPQEVRAWTIQRGTKAPQAAGKIHSDFERGFIRAEVISFDDLMACGSMTAARIGNTIFSTRRFLISTEEGYFFSCSFILILNSFFCLLYTSYYRYPKLNQLL